MGPFLVAVVVGLMVVVQPVQPEALNCSYHTGTDTVSCVSVDTAANSTSASRNLRVTCSHGSSRETVLRRDHFGRQPKLRSLAIDGCRIAKVRWGWAGWGWGDFFLMTSWFLVFVNN